MLAKILTNTAAQVLGKIFGASATLLLTFLLAKQVGADGYGEFVKITTFVGFFFLAADFGLNAMFLKKNYDWSVLLGLRIVISIILVFVAISILTFIPQGTTNGYTAITRLGIIFFAPAILLHAVITSANAIFQKHFHYDFGSISIFFGSFVTILVVYFFRGIFGSIAALLMGGLVTAAISLWFVRRLTPLSLTFSYRLFLPLFVSSIPLGFTMVSNLVYAHIDNVILALSRPTVEVGTYGFAYKIFETILVLPTFVMNALYPLLLSTRQNSKPAFIRLMKTAALVLFLFSLIVMIIVWMASPLIGLFHEQFTPSIGYLKILTLSLPLFFITPLVMWSLIVSGKQWKLAMLYFVGLIINIVANSIVIPTYGAVGASWVTVASEGAILIMSTLVLLRL